MILFSANCSKFLTPLASHEYGLTILTELQERRGPHYVVDLGMAAALVRMNARYATSRVPSTG
jgi:hypothetical protein